MQRTPDEEVDALRREALHAQALVRIASRLYALDSPGTLEGVCREVAEALGRPRAALWLVDRQAHEIFLEAAWASDPELGAGLPTRVPIARLEEHGIDGVGVLDLDRAALLELIGEATIAEHARTALVAPLRSRTELLGVMAVIGDRPEHIADGREREVVMAAAGLVGQAVIARRALHALRASEERFRRMVETTLDGVWAIDADDRTTFVNARMAEMFGTTPEALIGKPMYELVAPETRATAASNVERRRRGIAERHESRLVRVDGTQFLAIVSAAPVQGANGEYLGAIATVTDASERRQMDERIQQLVKHETLGTLAGGVAHDFNNLLAGILVNLELVMPDITDPETLSALEDARSAATRAADLSRQMLAYAGRGRTSITRLDANQLIRDTMALLHALVPKNVSIALSLAPTALGVDGDATQLRQVILGLAANASEAIGTRAGTVWITSGVLRADRDYLKDSFVPDVPPDGEYVFVRVRDEGGGVSLEVLPRIFDPFFTTKQQGRGLGLAEVMGILRAHRGAIRVSTEPGKGSTFEVLLPSAEKGRSRATIVSGEDKKLVLVADDEPAVRSAARRALERAGISVLLAADGVEALRVFRENEASITAVVLDLTMPGMSGREVLRAIRELSPKKPVLVSTGYAEEEGLAAAAGDPHAAVLGKPWSARELIVAVERLESGK